MFSQDYLIQSSQVDCFQKLKLSSLFTMFQDLSVSATEAINCGKSETLDRGYLWVVTKINLHVIRYPRYLEHVTFETFPNDMIHFIYPRSYICRDGKGKVLFTMKAFWILMNAKTRRIALPAETHLGVPGESDSQEVIDLLKELPSLEVKEKGSRKVQFSDVDLNGHLNNERYIEFMIDLEKKDFYAHHEICDMEIEYKKEVKEEENILFSTSTTNPSLVIGKVKDVLVYQALITYRSF